LDFLNPVFEAIGWLLALFYSVIPNFGVAIILLTFTIMLLLYPLTAKQAKSMIAMQRAQPEIKKLQAKYKGDKQKLNEETMKFYQENKINPLAGCLPLLVQMPIFFALFRVLRDPYEYIPKDSDLYASLCRGFGKFCGSDLTRTIQDKLGGTKIPGIAIGEQLLNHQTFLGMDLQLSAVDAHNSIFNAAPYFLLVGAVMLTGFLQTRQAQKRTPVANKQMGMVMRVLPVFFGLISLQFPAGLVLYFFVSNLWRLGQQEVIFRRFGSALQPTSGGKALPGAGKKTAVIDVESRDAADEDRNGEGPTAPAPRKAAAAKPKPKPKSTGAGQTGGGAPATAPRRGLRGLFELPPPPEGGNGGTPGKPGGTSGGGGGAKGAPKPPPTRNRSNKKKRKR
jgi:YidC/Oxa1 family membrane protein insertase